MTKTLEDVLKVWAARRFDDLPGRWIEGVHLEYAEGDGGCGCCGETPHANLYVEIGGYSRAPKIRTRQVTLLDKLEDVLRDLIQIAQEDSEMPGEPLSSGFSNFRPRGESDAVER